MEAIFPFFPLSLPLPIPVLFHQQILNISRFQPISKQWEDHNVEALESAGREAVGTLASLGGMELVPA